VWSSSLSFQVSFLRAHESRTGQGGFRGARNRRGAGGRRSASPVGPIAPGFKSHVHGGRHIGGPVAGGEMCFRRSRGVPLKIESESSDHESPAATCALSGRPKTFGASRRARRKPFRKVIAPGVATRLRSGATTWPLKFGSSTRRGGDAAFTRQTGSAAPTNDTRNTKRTDTNSSFANGAQPITRGGSKGTPGTTAEL